jgi:hypothetical protein
MLCSDFCNEEAEINNSSCLADCEKAVEDLNNKNNLYKNLLKKYNLYLAKQEFFNEKNKPEIKFEGSKQTLEENINTTNENIKALKKQLYDEETKLLNLYNLKKNNF